jgi:RNA polymerase sigma factor (TIGR02999 family)
MAEITQLLDRVKAGDGAAESELYAQVYARLHALAHQQLRGDGRYAHTTSLIHEMWLKLPDSLDVANRSHFFAVAATAMRQIVVDRARRACADKRGGALPVLSLSHADGVVDGNDPVLLLSVDRALDGLRTLDGKLATLVELKVYGGLDGEELANALDVSERTVKRWWRQARAYLISEVG